jgi:hypothetical protein
MPQIRRWMVAPRLGVALVGAGAMLVAGSGIAQAAYGPPPPPVSVPGGYLTVVTSQDCGPGGISIGPVNAGNTMTTVTVPAGDCGTQSRITITEPDISAIGNAGLCGYKAAAGVGVIIQNPDGSVDNAFLTSPIVVTISSPTITPGSVIVEWNGERFIRVGVAAHAGEVTVKLTHAGETFFAILQPTGTEFDPCDGGGGPGGGAGLGGAGGFGGSGFGGFTPGSFGQPGIGQAFLAGLLGAFFGRMSSGEGVLFGQSAHVLGSFSRTAGARTIAFRG